MCDLVVGDRLMSWMVVVLARVVGIGDGNWNLPERLGDTG